MFKSIKIFTALVTLIAINIFSYQFFTRFDFTQGKIYTLSESSKKVTKSLPLKVDVKFFLSNNLPSQTEKIKLDIQDCLQEYEALSNGKLNLEYIDPLNDEEAKKMAYMMGVAPLSLSVIEKDQKQSIQGYMGIALAIPKEEATENPQNPLENFEKFETVDIFSSRGGFIGSTQLEYEITSTLKKISSEEEKVVGFLSGHDEHTFTQVQRNFFAPQNNNPRADYAIREALQKNYTVQTVTINNEEEKPVIDNVDTLVVAGPQKALTEKETAAIHEFIKNGGNAIFLIDQISITSMYGQKMKESFTNLLDHWGIIVQKNLVQDTQHAEAQFSQGFFSMSLPYAFWVKVKNFNQKNNITSQLESLVLPWVSSLKINQKEGVKTEILAFSSKKYNLAKAEKEQQVPKEKTEEEKKEEPKTEENEKTEEAKNEEPPEMETKIVDAPIDLNPRQNFSISRLQKDSVPLAVLAQKNEEGKVVIIGNSGFLSESVVRLYPENLIFFHNIVDTFTMGDDLISIRSKGVTDRSIKSNLTETEKNIIRWGNIIFLPLLVIIFGMLRKLSRNAKKRG